MSIVRSFHAFLASLALMFVDRPALAQAPPPSQPFLTPAAVPIAGAPPCDPSVPPANLPDYRTVPRSLLPRTLRYKPEESIPFGYELKMQPRWGFVIAGAVMFGATYLPTALVGSALGTGPEDDGFGWVMLVPLAGPFLSIGLESGAGSVAKGLAIVNGLLQISGAGLVTAGLLAKEEYLEQTGPKSVKRSSFTVLLGPQSAALRWQF